MGFWRSRTVLLIAAYLLPSSLFSIATVARASDLFPPCSFALDHLFADRLFDAHKVSVPNYRSVRPSLRRGRAHLYRTVISSDAEKGANFAGHYTLSFAGCGTRTACIAIIDQQTGRVYFPNQMKTASRLFVDTGDRDYEALTYKLDSNLLVLLGTANEDPQTEGVSYYLWRNNRLRLIGRTAIRDLCDWKSDRQKF